MNSPDLEIRFKRPRFFSNLFLQLNFGAVIGLLAAAFIIKIEHGKNMPMWLVLAIFVLFIAIAFIARYFTIRKQIKPIKFENDTLLLPYGSESFSCKKTPYEHVYSFDVRGKPGKQRLIIDTKSRVFAYPLKDFQEPDAAETFGHNLHKRIGLPPWGEGRWQRLLNLQMLAGHLSERKYPITVLLLGIIAAVYIFQVLVGAERNPLKLLELGANAPGLVGEGQWYRLIAANFLHANLIHVIVNVFALWLIGAILERLTGSLRFLLIFLVSGMLGAVCSTLFINLLFSVGASASVFGLLGALAFINWRFCNELPGGYRIPVHSWLILLGVNTALPFFIPQIDIFAHIGGFIGGALAASILYSKQDTLMKPPGDSRTMKALTVALIGVFLLGVAQVIAHYPDASKNNSDRVRLANHLLQSPDGNEVLLNNVAWSLAIDPASTNEALTASREIAGRAVEMAKNQHVRNEVTTYLDTLATAHYRLGNFDKAVEIERDAFNRDKKAFYASQLARFLKARVEKNGLYLLGDAALADIGLGKPANDNEPIIIDIDRPVPQGLALYAYALDADNRILGLLHLSVAPVENHKSYTLPLEPEVTKLLAGSQRLVPALIDANDCQCSHSGIDWEFWVYDESISGLP